MQELQVWVDLAAEDEVVVLAVVLLAEVAVALVVRPVWVVDLAEVLQV